MVDRSQISNFAGLFSVIILVTVFAVPSFAELYEQTPLYDTPQKNQNIIQQDQSSGQDKQYTRVSLHTDTAVIKEGKVLRIWGLLETYSNSYPVPNHTVYLYDGNNYIDKTRTNEKGQFVFEWQTESKSSGSGGSLYYFRAYFAGTDQLHPSKSEYEKNKVYVTPNKLFKRTVYVDAVPDPIDFTQRDLQETFDFWEKQVPGVKFSLDSNIEGSDLRIRWIKQISPERVGETFSKSIIQVGYGSDQCNGKWMPFSSKYIKDIIIHELGHTLGYGHSSNKDSVMYPVVKDIEFGMVQNIISLRESSSVFVPTCTIKETTSYSFDVKTNDPRYGFDVYFVPSKSELTNLKNKGQFAYYGSNGCNAQNALSYSGVCHNVGRNAGLLITTDSKQSYRLTKITVNQEEIPSNGKRQTTSMASIESGKSRHDSGSTQESKTTVPEFPSLKRDDFFLPNDGISNWDKFLEYASTILDQKFKKIETDISKASDIAQRLESSSNTLDKDKKRWFEWIDSEVSRINEHIDQGNELDSSFIQKRHSVASEQLQLLKKYIDNPNKPWNDFSGILRNNTISLEDSLVRVNSDVDLINSLLASNINAEQRSQIKEHTRHYSQKLDESQEKIKSLQSFLDTQESKLEKIKKEIRDKQAEIDREFDSMLTKARKIQEQRMQQENKINSDNRQDQRSNTNERLRSKDLPPDEYGSNEPSLESGSEFQTTKKSLKDISGIVTVNNDKIKFGPYSDTKTVEIGGKVSNHSGETKFVTIHVTKPDGATNTITSQISGSGNFGSSIPVTKMSPLGSYMVTVSYGGQEIGRAFFEVTNSAEENLGLFSDAKESQEMPFVFSFIPWDDRQNAFEVKSMSAIGFWPKYWTVESGTSQTVGILANGDKDSLVLQYSVNGDSWRDVPVEPAGDAQSYAESLFGTSLPKGIGPDSFSVLESEIPPQKPGSYIRYRVVMDTDDDTVRSLDGLYYVTDPSKPRLLVIDPHVRLWLAQKHLQEGLDVVADSFANKMSSVGSLIKSEMAPYYSAYDANQDMEPFRNWHHISDDYHIRIISPSELDSSLLSEFKPDAIILSSLSLGMESQTNVLNWDLQSLGKFDILKDYASQNNAGIVATHSTLSDLAVWTSCSKNSASQIGSLGHIGSVLSDTISIKVASTKDGNTIPYADAKTVSGLLGFPYLSAYEEVKDRLAQDICLVNKATGNLVGSMPLHVPFVPFSGILHAQPADTAPDGLSLPSTISIETKNPYLRESLGKSYTELGWQLAVPYEFIDEKETGNLLQRQDVLGHSVFIPNQDSETMNAIEQAQTESMRWGINSMLEEIGDDIGHGKISGIFEVDGIDSLIVIDDIDSDSMAQTIRDRLPRLAAVSDDKRAGIISYDKHWIPDGYRSVYISMEPEVSESVQAEDILKSSIEWTSQWAYKPGNILPEQSDYEKQLSSVKTDDDIVVPKWVKSSSGQWAEGGASDDDFAKGIKYMITKDVIKVRQNDKTIKTTDIPEWIKDNAKWWNEGHISDADFARSIQYLMDNGIMRIN